MTDNSNIITLFKQAAKTKYGYLKINRLDDEQKCIRDENKKKNIKVLNL